MKNHSYFKKELGNEFYNLTIVNRIGDKETEMDCQINSLGEIITPNGCNWVTTLIEGNIIKPVIHVENEEATIFLDKCKEICRNNKVNFNKLMYLNLEY